MQLDSFAPCFLFRLLMSGWKIYYAFVDTKPYALLVYYYYYNYTY